MTDRLDSAEADRTPACACRRPSRPGEHSEIHCRVETTWGELVGRDAAAAEDAGTPGAPADETVKRGARALFDLTRSAQLSPDPDRLWERLCADGDRPYHLEAEAVLRAALAASGDAPPPESLTAPPAAPDRWGLAAPETPTAAVPDRVADVPTGGSQISDTGAVPEDASGG